MPRTIARPFISTLLAVSLLLGLALAGFTQEETLPSPGSDAAGQESPEVLTRGPVHEAFAEQINNDPDSGALIPNAPPEPIGEVPPEYKPEGENVLWIPGYWSWDDEREDYVWVSGVWRVPPQDRRWVPGYWHQQGEEGHYWISGFWISTTQDAVQYQQKPPLSIERGPTSAAPDTNHFWVPGCWNYNTTYRWRPGYWRPFRADGIWIPAHYVWTPRGSVFVSGYWDYRMPRRGQLFAPVYVRHHRHRNINYRYRPSCVINLGSIGMHLFIRPSYHHYYFGDYYGASYSSRRFYASFNFHSSGFGCDPFSTYYQWHFGRSGVNYTHRLRQSHSYFSNHQQHRPARTLKSQTNIVINQQNNTNVNINVLGRSLHDVARDNRSTQKLVRLANEQRTSHQRDLDQIRDFSKKRRDYERSHHAGKTPELSRRAGPDKLAGNRDDRTAPRQELALPPVRQRYRPEDPRSRSQDGDLARNLAAQNSRAKRPTTAVTPARPLPEKKANGKITRPAIVNKSPAPIVGPLPVGKTPRYRPEDPRSRSQASDLARKLAEQKANAKRPTTAATTARPVPEKKTNGKVTRTAIVNKSPAPIVGPLPAAKTPTRKTNRPTPVPQVTKTIGTPPIQTTTKRTPGLPAVTRPAPQTVKTLPSRPVPEKKTNGKVTRPAIVNKSPAPIVGPLPAAKTPTRKTNRPTPVPQVTKTTKAPPVHATTKRTPRLPAVTRPAPKTVKTLPARVPVRATPSQPKRSAAPTAMRTPSAPSRSTPARTAPVRKSTAPERQPVTRSSGTRSPSRPIVGPLPASSSRSSTTRSKVPATTRTVPARTAPVRKSTAPARQPVTRSSGTRSPSKPIVGPLPASSSRSSTTRSKVPATTRTVPARTAPVRKSTAPARQPVTRSSGTRSPSRPIVGPLPASSSRSSTTRSKVPATTRTVPARTAPVRKSTAPARSTPVRKSATPSRSNTRQAAPSRPATGSRIGSSTAPSRSSTRQAASSRPATGSRLGSSTAPSRSSTRQAAPSRPSTGSRLGSSTAPSRSSTRRAAPSRPATGSRTGSSASPRKATASPRKK